MLRATAADVLTLAVSDVPGDDPATIGSGPSVEVGEQPDRARAVLERIGLWKTLPRDVRAAVEERPAAAPVRARHVGFRVVCSVADAVNAASDELAERGYDVVTDAGELDGDAGRAAGTIASRIERLLAERGERFAFALGGETTVQVPASAVSGGRNQHLAAGIALRLAAQGEFAVVCGGTDGRDGATAYAGAVVDARTASRAAQAGHDLARAIATFDTSTALVAADDVLQTGDTGTNVGDLVVAAGSPR